MYIIFLLVMLLLPILAQLNVTATYKKYSKVANSRGVTAEDVARRILEANGIYDVGIEHISGNLTDHYDPTAKVVRLSDSVYGSTSVAAIGVAAHECGHVCQHATQYTPIVIRSKIVPATNFCSRLWSLVFIVGIWIANSTGSLAVCYAALAMFCAVILFQLVTLPTELDASHRALKTLESEGILESTEIPSARKVLTAAAMTYVTALVTSIIHLLYYLSMLNGGKRRR